MKNIKKLFLAFILGFAVLVPMQVNAATRHREPRVYSYDPAKDVAVKYGIEQYRIKELCPSPAVFSWYDNGIPTDVMGHYNPGALDFMSGKVEDAGSVAMDSGYHFHKFLAKMNDGRKIAFWACVDPNNKETKCNNCLDKLLYAY